jgi:glucokinase
MNKKKYILTMDIGGTTFTSALFDSDFNQVGMSMESYIKEYGSKTDLISGFTSQLKRLYSEHNISMDEIIGLGISAPGPLDSRKGLILETPNLTLLQNTNLTELMEAELGIPVKIENDANLFVWGEWYRHYRKESVITGLTLGSGLGVGVVIEGRVFTGSHGMGAEYGISPVKWGVWEDEISIEGIEKLSIIEFLKVKSPKELYKMAEDGNVKSQKIWQEFGHKLGLVSSHLINLLDPAVITLGGGVSKAYPYFIDSMKEVLIEYSPSFTYYSIKINASKNQLNSTHLGAAMFVREKN